MQKNRWTSSLKSAKRAKDKSIYNFIKWRYLLTTGNQATFYDYKVFIEHFFFKFCYLVSDLESLAIYCNFNFGEIYALFGVSSFHLKSWLCKILDI